MTWMPLLVSIQAAAEIAPELDQIAGAQIVMAIGTSVLVLAAVATMVGALVLFRSVRRLIDALERQADLLAPRATPLLDQATRVADDARAVSRAFRADAENVHDTIDTVNRRLRATLDEADERVRRFGTVLQVIQDEIEVLLLDTAATARGLHATAEGLRQSTAERRPSRGTARDE